MKVWFGLGIAVASHMVIEMSASAEPLGAVARYTCVVSDVSQVADTFFGTAVGIPLPPAMGDRITLDFSGTSIADLTFESGRGVPLGRFGVTLEKEPTEQRYYAKYGAMRQGTLAYYEALLTATLLGPNALVELRIVKDTGEGQQLETFAADLTCAVSA